MRTLTEKIVCDRCNETIVADPDHGEGSQYGCYFTVDYQTNPADGAEMPVVRSVHFCPVHWTELAQLVFGEELSWTKAQSRLKGLEQQGDEYAEVDQRRVILSRYIEEGTVPDEVSLT